MEYTSTVSDSPNQTHGVADHPPRSGAGGSVVNGGAMKKLLALAVALLVVPVIAGVAAAGGHGPMDGAASATARFLVEDLATFPQLAGMDITSAGDHVAGHGSVNAGAGESFEVGARSEADGTNALGHIVAKLRPALGATEPTLFHGHVREGCMIVVGNQAAVVGRLSESEAFFSAGRRIGFIAVRVVDNGPPVNGQPVDLGRPILLFDTTAENLCTSGNIAALAPALPLESGHVVVKDTVATD